MREYIVYFTVHGILTSFAEKVSANFFDHDKFRDILNDRIKALGMPGSVDHIFFITTPEPQGETS